MHLALYNTHSATDDQTIKLYRVARSSLLALRDVILLCVLSLNVSRTAVHAAAFSDHGVHAAAG